MKQSLEKIIEDAKEEFKENYKSYEYATDLIHEITDNTCLLDNYTFLKLACDNLDLALNEPELGPAFDGSATPINIICANLYEYISNELFQYLHILQDKGYREAA